MKIPYLGWYLGAGLIFGICLLIFAIALYRDPNKIKVRSVALAIPISIALFVCGGFSLSGVSVWGLISNGWGKGLGGGNGNGGPVKNAPIILHGGSLEAQIGVDGYAWSAYKKDYSSNILAVSSANPPAYYIYVYNSGTLQDTWNVTTNWRMDILWNDDSGNMDSSTILQACSTYSCATNGALADGQLYLLGDHSSGKYTDGTFTTPSPDFTDVTYAVNFCKPHSHTVCPNRKHINTINFWANTASTSPTSIYSCSGGSCDVLFSPTPLP